MRVLIAAPLCLSACAWDAPIDPLASTPGNVIQGSLVVAADVAPANTYVLFFDINDPPPPSGTGGPIGFSAVSASAFTGEGAGVQSAPYSLTGVPDGDWLVTALMDVDGDFHPLLGATSGATCGDWGGAHVGDLVGLTPAAVSVSGGQLLDDVTVAVGSHVSIERPAFAFFENLVGRDPTVPQTFSLASTGVYSELVELTGPYDGSDACDTFFLATIPDADGDGMVDPHPTYGEDIPDLVDVWPRVYLRFIDDGTLEPGEGYVAEAVVYPDFLLDGRVGVGESGAVLDLDVIFLPIAQHQLPDGTVEVVQGADLPAGGWAVTVVSSTGQTWTVPNETAGFPSTDESFDPRTQAGFLLVE